MTPEVAVSNEEVPSTSQTLPLEPQMPPAEPQLDLEQQWQDIMAIMELQVRFLIFLFVAFEFQQWVQLSLLYWKYTWKYQNLLC